jgi:serine/threonine protein kinase
MVPMKDDSFTARIQVPPVHRMAADDPSDLSERKTVRLAAPPAHAAAAAPTPLAASYAIQEKIGDGGMGVVYLARDRKLGRYVAIKRLNKSALSDENLRRRFFREAEAVAALHHNNIVHVYSLAEDAEGPYIVMEYVPGPQDASPDKTPPRPFTLADKVHRDGPMNVTQALGMAISICRAMEYAHACGVIHRDLKPSNILLDAEGEPRIVDFGLAHKAAPDGIPLTVPGEKMLSLGYGAPEQEKDASRTDERTDVYGLGGLLYFSLTGQNPRFFREKDVPEALRAPIVRALETDQTRRWPNVGEFTQALIQVHAPSSIELPTVKTTWRCKWCDTVNPVAIQYCGRCGWNGGELCAECGAESRVGVQFCGVCGADAREYERAALLLKNLLDHRERREFEYVARHAGQLTGFQPVGGGGQRLADRIRRLQEEAVQAIERRRTLRQFIDREVKDENYESARKHIEEFQRLSNDTLFDNLLHDLPGLIAARDLKRARSALSAGQLDYARRTCMHVLSDILPGNRDARALLRTIARRQLQLGLARVTAACLALFVLYVLSAAPASRMAGPARQAGLAALYRPVYRLHALTFLRRPLELYAELLGAGHMFDRREDAVFHDDAAPMDSRRHE